VIATVAAIATPPTLSFLDNYRVGIAVREVERELQFARLKAVSVEQPMRIRFNCPADGSLRVVELIGTPSSPDVNDDDRVSTRCSESTYPYHPSGGNSRLTRPANDGPLRTLSSGVTLAAAKTLEFWPDGTVHADAGSGSPWPI